ncbi:coiled-coil domain-containing protein [Vibrio penaeicida]|uniref:DNA-binding protein n=1 Tax=Vibrio penaeicida TaxID=104609 RepID=A0AAV5NLR1_9VIBR|nr:hypothetical protein [Vibrio penaeicida]RTZ20307.1 hypothetical protein EKN09_24495 [Vibrio penaeicida]GLQ71157.1 hypothetical protein GCM10007932_05170 [Vibrio penaeicida]
MTNSTQDATKQDYEERLFKIADTMVQNGEKVTIRSILDKFPDINSTSTLSPAYTKWREAQREQINSINNRLSFSPSFNSALIAEVSRLLDAEKALLESDRADLEDQVGILHRELSIQADKFKEAVDTINALKRENSDQRAELQLSAKQIGELREAHAQELQKKEEQHKQQIEEKEQLFSQKLEEKESLIIRHEAKIESLNEANQHNSSEASKYKVLEGQAREQLVAANEEKQTLQEQLKVLPDLRSELNVEKALKTSKQDALTALQGRYDTLQEQSVQLNSQLEVNRSKLETYDQKVQELSNLSKLLNDAQNQISTLSTSERAMVQDMKEMQLELNRREYAQQENANLRGELNATREQLNNSVKQITSLTQQLNKNSD